MRLMRIILSLIVLVFSFIPIKPIVAIAEECKRYDFNSLFIDDYYPGTSWVKPGQTRVIAWSTSTLRLNGDPVVRTFSEEEKDWLRLAIQSWDATSKAFSFKEVTSNSELDIGWTTLNDQPDSIWAVWSALWDSSKIRYRATIKLREGHYFLNSKDGFVHAIQHELGNILGLGDLNPSPDFISVLEDPWQGPYGNLILSDLDYSLMRQLYGESTCPSSWKDSVAPSASPTPTPTSTPTPITTQSPFPNPSPTNSSPSLRSKNNKKITVTCFKGKLLKKVTAINPKCPKGYKKK